MMHLSDPVIVYIYNMFSQNRKKIIKKKCIIYNIFILGFNISNKVNNNNNDRNFIIIKSRIR